jgi:hypothetical protein
MQQRCEQRIIAADLDSCSTVIGARIVRGFACAIVVQKCDAGAGIAYRPLGHCTYTGIRYTAAE